MKRNHIAIALFIALFSQILYAQEKSGIKFNYGIKAGFQAVTYNHNSFCIDGYNFNDNTIQSDKIGYTINPFMRFTWKHFYFQTEGAIGITRHKFDFIPQETSLLGDANPEYRLTTYCMQVPLLLGYNFIDQENYGMSVFTGTRTKFIFTSRSKQEFSDFKYEGLEEELTTPVYYWEIGLGVRIYNVFFDVTYDWGFIESKNVITDKESGREFLSKRSDNILSFTVGFIF